MKQWVCSVSMPEDLFRKLGEIAKKEDRTRSSVIRRMIRHALGDHETIIDKHYEVSPPEDPSEKILRLIKTNGSQGITRNHLTRKTQYLNHQERESILTDLIKSGQVIAEQQKTGGGKRREPMLYRIT